MYTCMLEDYSATINPYYPWANCWFTGRGSTPATARWHFQVARRGGWVGLRVKIGDIGTSGNHDFFVSIVLILWNKVPTDCWCLTAYISQKTRTSVVEQVELCSNHQWSQLRHNVPAVPGMWAASKCTSFMARGHTKIPRRRTAREAVDFRRGIHSCKDLCDTRDRTFAKKNYM